LMKIKPFGSLSAKPSKRCLLDARRKGRANDTHHTNFQRGPIWWIAYYFNGEQKRESSNSERESDAKRLLKDVWAKPAKENS
jgi:hypothetical protein